MEYNGLLERWGDMPNSRQSRRFRFSPLPAYQFSGKEFEDYMILAWRFGFLKRSTFQEVEWVAGAEKLSYKLEDEIVCLTKEGWDFIEVYDRPFLHRAGSKLLEDWPTILFSVIAAVISSWVLYNWGASN